jgi:aspartate racemase
MRTVGILAGMGPRSTAPFIDQVVTEFQRQCGARFDADFPPMVTLSWPTPFAIERPVDHAALRESIAAGLHRLEQCGVDFIVMPSNTAHIYYDVLQQNVSVPMINMIEETIRALPDTAQRIALLTTRATADSTLYQEGIYRKRSNVRVLDTEIWQTDVDELIKSIKTARRRNIPQARWRALMECVRAENADAVIVACTDISALIHTGVADDIPIIDAAQCLAAATVRWWRLHE